MNGEAFIAAPGITKAENLQCIEERMRFFLVATGKHEGENAGGAGKVTLPDFMAGVAFQCGMQDTVDCRMAFKPSRNFHGTLAVMFQPHAHGPHAAQDLVGIVSRRAQSKRPVGFRSCGQHFHWPKPCRTKYRNGRMDIWSRHGW